MTEKTEDVINRNKRLIALYQESVRSEGSKLLRTLPQGPGSGLNADLVDGKHAQEILSEAARLGKKRGGGGIEHEYQHSYDFKVEKEGLSTYGVRNRAGVRKPGSTYPELAIKEALDSLTSARTHPEKVLLKGNFPNLDYPAGNVNCIDLDDYTFLEILGKMGLADGVNKTLLGNSDVTNGNSFIKVKGGLWDLNYGEQTSGRGFAFLNASGSMQSITLEDIITLYGGAAKENCLHVQRATEIKVLNSKLTSFSGHGIYLDVVSDSWLRGINASGGKCAFMLQYGASNDINGMYCGYAGGGDATFKGEFVLNRTNGNIISNLRVDNHFCAGIILKAPSGYFTAGNQFSTIHVSNPGREENDFPAVSVDGDGAIENTWDNLRFRRWDAELWTYGVQEINNADFNVYNSGLAKAVDFVTGIKLLGVNSDWALKEI